MLAVDVIAGLRADGANGALCHRHLSVFMQGIAAVTRTAVCDLSVESLPLLRCISNIDAAAQTFTEV